MAHAHTLDVGRDVHQESIAVAEVAEARGAEGVFLGTIGTRPCDLDPLVRTRPSQAPPRRLVDEAGPWGSGLDRSRTKTHLVCGVVAPARIPKQPGDRVQTDRRDALPLARLRRAGDLTPVSGPAVEDEASRARARAAAMRELQAAQNRVQAFRRRPDLRDAGRATWGPAHRRWRSDVVGPTPAPPIAFHADVRAVTDHRERRQRLAQARHDQGTSGRVPPVVAALHALRGVHWTVAVTTVAARGARTRGEHPRHLRPCLGRIPSEDATRARRRPGSRTTAGHTQARRTRVEGAWACRDPAHVSRPLPRRLEPHPTAIQAISGNAPVRRCTRDRRLLARGTQAHQVVVAMARARVGCLGAMAN